MSEKELHLRTRKTLNALKSFPLMSFKALKSRKLMKECPPLILRLFHKLKVDNIRLMQSIENQKKILSRTLIMLLKEMKE
jgi:hypothetical protein